MPAVLHAYEMLPLFWAGGILGIVLIVEHLVMLIFPERVKALLSTIHGNHGAAAALLALDFLWAFLLIADIPGTHMGVDLDLFAVWKPYLMLLCPLMWVLMIVYVKEQLFPRALGFFLLLFVCPFMQAAFLEDPMTRLLIPVWAYAVIVFALIWVAKPYLFHRMVEWVLAKKRLFAVFSWLGLIYGCAVLICAVLFWQ